MDKLSYMSLPSLYKALPGYKCLEQTCIAVLLAKDDDKVQCKHGYTFDREKDRVLKCKVLY